MDKLEIALSDVTISGIGLSELEGQGHHKKTYRVKLGPWVPTETEPPPKGHAVKQTWHPTYL